MNCKDGVCEIEEDSIENLTKRVRKRKEEIDRLLEGYKHD